MNRPVIFWLLALVITVASAYYQRVTGPTYPLRGTATLDGALIDYSLQRSHGGEGNAVIQVQVFENAVTGILEWKRYKTNDEWRHAEMVRKGENLVGELPHQPPAGKLEYRVVLAKENKSDIVVPPDQSVVIRFKGDVPPAILIPHIIAIFMAMLLSTRTALECFVAKPGLRGFTYWTIGLLAAGGMILGPIVQKFAFGEYWTGIPFGTDLTDNKTLIAFVSWLIALVALFKAKKPIPWIIAAAIVTLVIFLIPHSLFGSELKYTD